MLAREEFGRRGNIMVAKRPVNEKRVRRLRDSIIAESRALRLGEFRKSLDLTQVDTDSSHS